MSSFITQYPGRDEQNSVYFWWLEYLKRSDSYRKQCELGKGGSLYQDFGDIFKVGFAEWWEEHEDLFIHGSSFGVWPVENVEEFQQAIQDRWLVAKVDPNCSKDRLMFYFENLLDESGLNRKGRIKHNQEAIEPAKYPIYKRPNLPFLKLTLKIYDEYLINPKPLYKIGEKFSVPKNILPELKKPENYKEKRAIETSEISRYVKRAKQLIMNVEQGIFPKHS